MKVVASDFAYYIVSLGCSKNQTDSERINSQLNSLGMSAVDDAEHADIIIINTCGFIEAAKKETIETIFDALNLKETNEDKKVIVTGCFSQRYREELKKEIPEVDFVYGIIDDKFIDEICIFFNIKTQEFIQDKRKPLIENLPYEYIKISEGCSNNCSYCAIPLIRGPIISYKPHKIIDDAKDAAQRGVKELIIIAQDIASYKYESVDLAGILEEISNIDGPEWIRLLYCHPDHITEKFIKIMAENKKIVPYLDIPFQHVNKTILSSMNRKGDYNKYMELIDKFRSQIPDISIRSTFMVGYPGETEEQFEEILKFLKEAKLDRVGCFKYSKEEDTNAYDLEDHEEKIKEKRYHRLMEVQKEISIEKMKSRIGQEVRVLVEEKIDNNNWLGRTEYDAPEVDGIFYLTGSSVKLNTIVRVKVTDSLEYDLVGKI